MNATHLGFRMLTDAAFESQVAVALQAAVEDLQGQLEDLRGVVLTGSLARGEGAVLDDGDGPQLLSDIDLYAVVGNPEHIDAQQHHHRVMEAMRRRLGDTTTLDLGFVGPEHLGRGGHTLPAHQMAHGARVLFDSGRDWSPPSTASGSNPDADDATLLWFNRAAEHLLARSQATAPDADERFHRWKLWWDAPLAFLAASGHYHPDRPQQWGILSEHATPALRGWMLEGLTRLETMWAQLQSGALNTETLVALGGVAESGCEDRDEDLRRWICPYLNALMYRRDGLPSWNALETAVITQGAQLDREALGRWLRRRGPGQSLRVARQWAPLSGQIRRPWWRYGWGGIGPERVLVAAALRLVHDASWFAPLRSMFTASEQPTDDAQVDAWLGGLWSDWLMGGRRR